MLYLLKLYKNNGIKISETLTNPVINESGEITSIAKLRGIQHSLRLRVKSKKYIVKNVFNSDYEEIMDAVTVRSICNNLESKNQDNYLGKSKSAATTLKNNNKTELIGLYVEKLP